LFNSPDYGMCLRLCSPKDFLKRSSITSVTLHALLLEYNSSSLKNNNNNNNSKKTNREEKRDQEREREKEKRDVLTDTE